MIAASLLALSAILGSSRNAPAPPEPEPKAPAVASDRVETYDAGDAEYRALEVVERTVPEAERRLVVYRGNVPVLDRGLRNEKASAPTKDGAPATEEMGTFESAEASQDGRFAVLVTTTYRKPIDPRSQVSARGRSELTWIDSAHPRGLWSAMLEEGRVIKEVLPVSTRDGVAIATINELSGPADLRLLSPEGIEMLRLPADQGEVVGMRTTSYGGFLAVDLAYPDQPGRPNRGIAMLDLLHGTRWNYTWSYGDDKEPTSWILADTGVLEITMPGSTQSYDRNGRPLHEGKKKKSRN